MAVLYSVRIVLIHNATAPHWFGRRAALNSSFRTCCHALRRMFGRLARIDAGTRRFSGAFSSGRADFFSARRGHNGIANRNNKNPPGRVKEPKMAGGKLLYGFVAGAGGGEGFACGTVVFGVGRAGSVVVGAFSVVLGPGV